jgi:hypothetical protein
MDLLGDELKFVCGSRPQYIPFSACFRADLGIPQGQRIHFYVIFG